MSSSYPTVLLGQPWRFALEAMDCGTPAVALADSALPETDIVACRNLDAYDRQLRADG